MIAILFDIRTETMRMLLQLVTESSRYLGDMHVTRSKTYSALPLDCLHKFASRYVFVSLCAFYGLSEYKAASAADSFPYVVNSSCCPALILHSKIQPFPITGNHNDCRT